MYAVVGALGAAAWLLWQAWGVLTGPQNPSGWFFTLGVFIVAPGIGWVAAQVLERRSSRHRA